MNLGMEKLSWIPRSERTKLIRNKPTVAYKVDGQSRKLIDGMKMNFIH